MSADPISTIRVRKRDGSLAPYDGNEVAASIIDSARGLDDAVARATLLQAEVEITLFDGITTDALDEAVIQVALGNAKDDPAFDTIASRIAVKKLYKEVFGNTHDSLGDVDPEQVHDLHRSYFPRTIAKLVADGYLDERLERIFNLEALAAALDPTRDDLIGFTGVRTMINRYLLRTPDKKALEVPQYFWMRVAMGLSITEDDPTSSALTLYNSMSNLRHLAAGSTLVNAGTPSAQLSNCFVMRTEDDLEHIAQTIRDVMWITKGTGGIGLSMSDLRCEGSPIRSDNTASTGPIPFIHTIDSTLRAVSRGGKKLGALCFYLENWHLDFPQFLDLRQNSGDPYRRTRTADTAVWISDEFMKRVAKDEDWYLFDPAETPDLTELTGAAFSKRYAYYVAQAQAGKIKRFRRTTAREQFRTILVSLQTTSHPWLTWKDSVNTRALNNNTGTIHSSNLCTEICLPQDRDHTSVCNLASVNLAAHLVGPRGKRRLNWDQLAATTRLAVRHLDNLVDITASAVPQAQRSNEENRAIGLGVMGLTDMLEQIRVPYDSPEACEIVDRVVEFISWHAIDTSSDLATERGSYPMFEGSGWSRGMVPVDTLAVLERDRGIPVDVDRTTRMDWDALRAKVRTGIRNATLMAIAPTASIGFIAGTTPGLDPQFSQMFSRTTSAGKFLEVNRNLVADLKDLGLWDSTREELLRRQGDPSEIDAIPASLRHLYRTSFTLDPIAYLNVAARAQKWVDQAISRNIYLASRSVGDMEDLYTAAWRMGVKTTYYLHMLPRHTAEQSTVAVNKAAGRRNGPRRGFATTVRRSSRTATIEKPVIEEFDEVKPVSLNLIDGTTCPVDPQERQQCESCQ
ncbi:ribonucleoside-diphosphate reductase [Cutibacterium modestum]|uniref:Ribonucleoside-diphosphate reductase n=2 Tax=Cutibacterium modestum TaxID=2559073 RepID=A0AAD1KQE6_9ACTN|nr:ribonucleoside-diphosphate reductase subunit alpha [Cutibacterium modestum]EFS92575.1 ribonucleoside-diphosphate reductase, alpha subunit [Cutibacterium modestum HL044PA1]BCY26263.1 ribonucleoside-diphosphate reductase [Cutibacterium modestum]